MCVLTTDAQQPATTNILSMFWSYYVRSLAKKGVREDILYAYHRAMAGLPWAEFYPDVYCMESMIKVGLTFSECDSMGRCMMLQKVCVCVCVVPCVLIFYGGFSMITK